MKKNTFKLLQYLDASPKVPNSHVNGISIDSNYSTILFQNFSNLILRTHKQPFYLLQGEINTNFAVKMGKIVCGLFSTHSLCIIVLFTSHFSLSQTLSSCRDFKHNHTFTYSNLIHNHLSKKENSLRVTDDRFTNHKHMGWIEKNHQC